MKKTLKTLAFSVIIAMLAAVVLPLTQSYAMVRNVRLWQTDFETEEVAKDTNLQTYIN